MFEDYGIGILQTCFNYGHEIGLKIIYQLIPEHILKPILFDTLTDFFIYHNYLTDNPSVNQAILRRNRRLVLTKLAGLNKDFLKQYYCKVKDKEFATFNDKVKIDLVKSLK